MAENLVPPSPEVMRIAQVFHEAYERELNVQTALIRNFDTEEGRLNLAPEVIKLYEGDARGNGGGYANHSYDYRLHHPSCSFGAAIRQYRLNSRSPYGIG